MMTFGLFVAIAVLAQVAALVVMVRSPKEQELRVAVETRRSRRR